MRRLLVVGIALGMSVLGMSAFVVSPVHGAAQRQSFTWSTKNNVDTSGGRLLGISCPSTSLCIAVDRMGYAFTSSDPADGAASTWASVKLPVCSGLVTPGSQSACGPALNGVFCASTSLCLATGTDSHNHGAIFTTTDPADGAAAAWTVTEAPAVDNGLPAATGRISCPSKTFCVIADPNQGHVLVSSDPADGASATWTAETVGSSGGYGVNGIACPSSSLCVALTSDGHAYGSSDPGDGASARWELNSRLNSSIGLDDVSCPTTALCVIVDGFGGAWTSTDPADGAAATWSPKSADPPGVDYGDWYSLNGVSCPSTSLCVAVDKRGRAVTTTGPADGSSAVWAIQPVFAPSLAASLDGVSCPSTSLCVAVASTQVGNGSYYGSIGVGKLVSTYGLSVSTTPSPSANTNAYGYAVSSPTGIDCGWVGSAHASCTAQFASGTRVTLSAVPYASPTNPSLSYSFAGWGGACSGAGTCTLTMDGDESVSATFHLVSDTVLTVNRAGPGSGTVTGILYGGEYGRPLDVDCGSNCSAHFSKGSQVILTAAPSADSRFAAWAACPRVDSSGRCWVTMDADKSVTATFARLSLPPPDTTPPTATASTSRGERGGIAELGYSVRDDSGEANTTVTVYAKSGRTLWRKSAGWSETGSAVRHVPYQVPRSLSGNPYFCVVAVDRAGNRSRASCAALRLG